jgi:hypothetical protein
MSMQEPDILSQQFDEYMEWLVNSLGDQPITEERVDREYSTWLLLKSHLKDKSSKVPVFEGLPDVCTSTINEGWF